MLTFFDPLGFLVTGIVTLGRGCLCGVCVAILWLRTAGYRSERVKGTWANLLGTVLSRGEAMIRGNRFVGKKVGNDR